MVGQHVNQKLDAILRADRAGNGAKNRDENNGMGDWSLPHVTKDKGKRATGVITQIGHAYSISFDKNLLGPRHPNSYDNAAK
jgi:hypothetical protein